MTAEVTRLVVREPTPESIRALVRTTIFGIERSFNTVDRLQSRTRLALALSLLAGGAGISPAVRQVDDRTCGRIGKTER